MNKFLNKLILGLVVIPVGALVAISVVSCSNTSSPTPEKPEEPIVPIPPTPPDPEVPPIPPPTNNNMYDYQRFYEVKNSQFLDGHYAGLISNSKIIANTPYAESNMHVVPTSLSKLPSFFTTNDILSLISLKDVSITPTSIEIIDYSDALRTSGIQNWFEHSSSFPSQIPHTDNSGRAKYKILPVDKDYKIIAGTTTASSFDYSYIDVAINFSTPNETIVNHKFTHTFLFSEGINEIRYGNKQSQAYLPLLMTADQKVILGNDKNNIQLVVETLAPAPDHTTFDTNILKYFVEIKHMKPSSNIEDSNSNNYADGVNKIPFALPLNLSYVPILKNETNTTVMMYGKGGLTINAQDINNGNSSASQSVKWHNFGKLGAKDTFYRGRSTTGGIGTWNNELSWIWGS